MNKPKQCITVLTVLLLTTVGWAKQDNAGQPLRLELDLVDGSRIIGVPTIKSVAVQTTYAKMDIPLKQIVNIKIEDDHETASFEMRNADKLKGVLNLKPIELKTIFGEVLVGVQHVTSIRVHAGGPTTRGLVLYYSFDSEGAEALEDHSGQQIAPTDHGTTRGAEGAKGACRIFDPSSYLDLGTPEQLAFVWTSPFTISLWIRTSIADGSKVIFAKDGGRASVKGYMLALHNGKPALSLFPRWHHDVRLCVQSGRLVTDGKWHFVAATYDGSKTVDGMKVYVDGVEGSTSVFKSSRLVRDFASSYPVRVGGAGFQPQFRGALDELMVFKRALSATEIRQAYNSRN